MVRRSCTTREESTAPAPHSADSARTAKPMKVEKNLGSIVEARKWEVARRGVIPPLQKSREVRSGDAFLYASTMSLPHLAPDPRPLIAFPRLHRAFDVDFRLRSQRMCGRFHFLVERVDVYLGSAQTGHDLRRSPFVSVDD